MVPVFLDGRGEVVFPHPLTADVDGLLAVSEHLRLEDLILAYHFGIFPWYDEDSLVLWWFTKPRFVLFPNEFKLSKSLGRLDKRRVYQVGFDTNFEAVMRQCATVRRKGQEGTWITGDMLRAYKALHGRGYAHSVEVYRGDRLVGGLYGVAIGKIFFGESMFSLESNTSKLALLYLVRRLAAQGFVLIDCQQETPHLASMGARSIPADVFYRYIRENLLRPEDLGHWDS